MLKYGNCIRYCKVYLGATWSPLHYETAKTLLLCPLFEEDFEAWANGPVCQVLYEYSKGKFSVDASEMKGDSNGLTDTQKATVNEILEHYGDKDAQWLSQLTHLEDPWKEARVGIPNGVSCDNIITKESMAIFYGGLD